MKFQLIDEKAASIFLNLSCATLRKWRSTGVPKLKTYKLGRAVKYSVHDLEEFIRQGARFGEE